MSSTSSTPVWFITGCSSGLGHALASHALDAGHRVSATARDPGSLSELVHRHPDTCLALPLDVRSDTQCKAAFQASLDHFGKVDFVVNNAGHGLLGAFEELSDEQVREVFETNFFGPLRILRTALPHLRSQRSGRLVFLSAAAAISNYPGLSAYGASKWAVEGIGESLASELAPLGIHVTLVEPGPFRTSFLGPAMIAAETSISDYGNTAGRFQKLLQSMHGRQTGDPGKAAAAIFQAANSDKPPLRLVLGKYAQDKLRKKLAATTAELEAWGPSSLHTEFSG